MRIETEFPGGVRVDAMVRGFRMPSDQPVEYGGGNSAPSPFEQFLASLATCAGFYAVQFCRKRDLATEGMAVRIEATRDPDTHLVAELRIEVDPPAGFPERYVGALLRAVDQCAVKRALENPPRLVTVVNDPVRAALPAELATH